MKRKHYIILLVAIICVPILLFLSYNEIFLKDHTLNITRDEIAHINYSNFLVNDKRILTKHSIPQKYHELLLFSLFPSTKCQVTKAFETPSLNLANLEIIKTNHDIINITLFDAAQGMCYYKINEARFSRIMLPFIEKQFQTHDAWGWDYAIVCLRLIKGVYKEDVEKKGSSEINTVIKDMEKTYGIRIDPVDLIPIDVNGDVSLPKKP